MSGRFRSRRNTLPMYMLATIPQNKSGRCAMKSGPGWMPWMISAPSNSAVTGLLGMPSDKTGMRLPATAELFADSGPATPSIAPLTKTTLLADRIRGLWAPGRAPIGGRRPQAPDAIGEQRRLCHGFNVAEDLGNSKQPDDDS